MRCCLGPYPGTANFRELQPQAKFVKRAALGVWTRCLGRLDHPRKLGHALAEHRYRVLVAPHPRQGRACLLRPVAVAGVQDLPEVFGDRA